jgi:type VI secretion system secreted protein VgrG
MMRAPASLFVLGLPILLLTPAASAAIAPVALGTADSFAVLAGTGITNTGGTTVHGDVGTYSNPSETGFGPAGFDNVAIVGTNHDADAVTQQAKVDLAAAYNATEARPGGTLIAGGELGGRTLVGGVYKDNGAPASLAITGTLTLDGQNDPSSVWIFQSASTLVTAANSTVVLTNGAQACNVFWQVGSSATLGTASSFEGTIMALTSITVNHFVTVHGRVLASNGAVTMDSDFIETVPCATSTSSSTSATSTSSSTSDSSSSTSGTGSTTDTSSASGTTTGSPSASTTPGTTSSSQTQTTGNGTSTGPVGIPFFPTTAAVGAAVVAVIGGAVLLLRRRLR